MSEVETKQEAHPRAKHPDFLQRVGLLALAAVIGFGVSYVLGQAGMQNSSDRGWIGVIAGIMFFVVGWNYVLRK